jgi:chemotaxis protein MotB
MVGSMKMRWLLLMLALGCVPKKQHVALETDLAETRTTLAETRTTLEARIAEQDRTIAVRDARVAELEEALRAEEAEVDRLTSEIADQEARIETLTGEKAALVKDRTALRASVKEMEQALAELRKRKAAAEKRVLEFRELLARFKTLIDAGQLQVRIANGRMVVALATDVLFSSGSARLSSEGEEAILAVAEVLAQIPDRRYQVEGHTDNVPIATERFPSNWELASARAITVVRVLREGGVLPERVSGASYGEFQPVSDNGTPEGRAANRRIEIVLIPDLSLLPGFEELTALSEGE